jgi:hypothetical protein
MIRNSLTPTLSQRAREREFEAGAAGKAALCRRMRSTYERCSLINPLPEEKGLE